MQTKKKKTKSGWMVTAPMAVCAIAFLVFVFAPSVKKLREKRNELTTKRNYIAQAGDVALQLDLLAQEVSAAQSFIDKSKERLPMDDNLADVYARLNQTCNAAGVSVTRFEPSPPEPFELLKQLPIRLSTTGTYDEATRLLVGLDSLHGAVWLEEMRLAFGKNAGGNAGVDINLAVFANRSGNSD